MISDIKQRIRELRALARVEGADINADSEHDLLAWFAAHDDDERPIVTLLDNGNLRCCWYKAEGQLGLQFMGGGVVQYVALAQAGNGEHHLRGRVTING